MWIDISNVSNDSLAFRDYIRKTTGLYLSDGVEYGESGRCFLRMNIATPFSNVKDGTERLLKALNLYLNENK